jgi:hypothetical protein
VARLWRGCVLLRLGRTADARADLARLLDDDE